ncbi:MULTISPECIES: BBE domain-containing protein [Streptomyces]|uniref:Berberine/berberine-like domain-containing protein n=1 Tax=Streptomyces chartreusis NRRL 3882 TaxID=1079985 RepID=A0A2N9B1R1_STRCX|nr:MULTISPECIES: BBE domain-containing protein [Streptomyces]MYS93630.1 hypothetical protein [Streptomyces sp. SID5464]SOR77242.1 hypothetical protein SCNRRL3882_0717 [Streptomyces chartreusis NRRL 3882]
MTHRYAPGHPSATRCTTPRGPRRTTSSTQPPRTADATALHGRRAAARGGYRLAASPKIPGTVTAINVRALGGAIPEGVDEEATAFSRTGAACGSEAECRRLTELKAARDPRNLFRHNKNIAPSQLR